MAVDRSFIERNRAATERIISMAQRPETELQTPVGEHWTVAIVLAHLAWWDRLALGVLEKSQQQGKLVVPNFDITVNDISLPLWAAIPPRAAATLAVNAAQALDKALEACPEPLLEEVFKFRSRWVERWRHRGEHLDEADAALANH